MDYLSDDEYNSLTGNSFAWDPSMTELYGDSTYTPEVDSGYDNGYYDLAGQLAEAGIIPQDDYGAPDLSALLNMQFSGAIDNGSLGDLSQYQDTVPVGADAAQQMAIDQANLVGSGYEAVPGNSNVVIDPETGELIDKVDLADRLGAVKYGPMSMRNTRMNDLLASSQYPMSTVTDQGDIIAQQGPYSAVYDPNSQASFDQAAGLVSDQAEPDSWLQKLGSGALSMLKGSPAQAGGRSLPGNKSNAAPSGVQQGLSMAQLMALAGGVFQNSKGQAPGDKRPNPGAQNWNISRKAGSGRKGALQQVRG